MTQVFLRSVEHPLDVQWPEGWPVPPVGARFDLPGVEPLLEVRSVTWYPQGDRAMPDPFVLLVLGLPRPSWPQHERRADR